MAYSSTKSRLFNELARPNRTSSPNDFATAGSFDINNDQILNSTVNMGGNNTAPLPLNYDEHPDYPSSEAGSEGSAEMSIELGRGVKRDAREHDADVSSNLVFNFGGDSQYEVTGTPPIRPRNPSRKSDGTLRREASVRHATEAAKTNTAAKRQPSGIKHRSLSETIAKLSGESDEQPTVTFNARNTRFTRSRQTSATEQSPQPSRFTAAETTPRRSTAPINPTVQSATYTANSFALPDLPNITELVSGVRKDGTPVFNRTTKSRSRFTSGNYKPSSRTQQHIPVSSIPIPDEEKAIFSSLQLLKDKVASLEADKAEAAKRAEEYECEIIDLRSQLDSERRRPDSALGSDEESSAQEKLRMEKTRLQASVQALQERLDRSERKISVAEMKGERVRKERDELVTQIGVAYYQNEGLKAENEMFRESFVKLQAENDDLKDEVESLRKENEEMNLKLTWLGQKKGHGDGERMQRHEERRQYEIGPSQTTEQRTFRRRSLPTAQPQTTVHEEDIASRIAREVQKHRTEAMASKAVERTRETVHGQQAARRPSTAAGSNARSRSKSQHRQQSQPKRAVSAPLIESDISDAETTTEQQLTQKTKDTLKNMHLPSPAKPKSKPAVREEDSRDLTLLSFLDPNEVAKLRKKIEEEHRANRSKRNVSAPVQCVQRKSSLKDLTGGLNFDNGTGRFSLPGVGDAAKDETAKVAKTVRVQSPHTSDASLLPHQPHQQQERMEEGGDTSMLSNISRRRRRSVIEEGMTSAFILPDITLHTTQPHASTTGFASCIKHTAANCTICHPSSSSNPAEIPTPVPITDRSLPQDPDITTATLRPAQPPPLALALVLKQLEDEIIHLKLQLRKQQDMYLQHDPALGKRKRAVVKGRMEGLEREVERRCEQVYALYDVLEGQKLGGMEGRGEEVVEETLMSLGIDPQELAGRQGRGVGGLDGADDEGEESEELPWEGLSESE